MAPQNPLSAVGICVLQKKIPRARKAFGDFLPVCVRGVALWWWQRRCTVGGDPQPPPNTHTKFGLGGRYGHYAALLVAAIERAGLAHRQRNVVDPELIIETYGADTARLFMLSDSPPERDMEWTESGVEAASRFLKRVWRLAHDDNLAALAVVYVRVAGG